MKNLRFRILIFSCWLIACFSIERYVDPIDISDMTYIFILTIVITILFASQITKIPLWVIITVPITLLLILKLITIPVFMSTFVGITVFEVGAIIATILFTIWVSKGIFDFERAVSKIVIGHHDRIPESDVIGQGFIYREVRRARNHQRPLALMAVAIDEKSLKFSVDRIVQEVQASIMKQYVISGVSKLLCDHLEDCTIIVQNNDHFLIALPETRPEELPVIIERLRRQVTEHVGVELEIGTAMLPKDGLTFEGLVDKATIEMKLNLKSSVPVNLDKISSDQPITAAK